MALPRGGTLTHKQLETRFYVLSAVGTDILVRKHQAISIHGADSILIVSDRFHTNTLQLQSKKAKK